MKKFLCSLAVIALSTGAMAQKIAEVAQFVSESIDFGKIKQGVPQKGTFTVKNISNNPLLIEQANPTCGCTISDYTKTPIAPGQTGVINATYNAAAMGRFDKHLTVKFAGIDEIKQITFTGEVLSAEDYAKLYGGSSEASPSSAPNSESAGGKATPKSTGKNQGKPDNGSGTLPVTKNPKSTTASGKATKTGGVKPTKPASSPAAAEKQ